MKAAAVAMMMAMTLMSTAAMAKAPETREEVWQELKKEKGPATPYSNMLRLYQLIELIMTNQDSISLLQQAVIDLQQRESQCEATP